MPKSTKEPWQTTYKYIDSNRPNGRLERAHPVSYRPLTKHSIGSATIFFGDYADSSSHTEELHSKQIGGTFSPIVHFLGF
jgi:hypothetical protein